MGEVHTIKLGKAGESRVISDLLFKGCHVYPNSDESNRVDMVAEYNNKLYRLQIKTYTKLHPRDNHAELKFYQNRDINDKYTKADVDYMVFYVIPMGCILYIPIEDTSRNNSITLSGVKSNRTVIKLYEDFPHNPIKTEAMREQGEIFDRKDS